MRRRFVALALLVAAAPAFAAMQAKPVEWTLDKTTFRGVLVYDDAGGQRPGVVMVPDWKGVSDAAVDKAKHVAGKDYVVLVADVYGKDVRPKDDAEALAQVRKLYGDPQDLRARAAKALDALKAQAGKAPLDVGHLGALGYCFGGATVLELARSGAELAGVVTFHGALDTPLPAQPGAIKASLLVLNGADDKSTAGEIAGFKKEMTDAGADWQFVDFSGAEHCFALPTANKPGCVYDERATRRGEAMMRDFFAERFATQAAATR